MLRQAQVQTILVAVTHNAQEKGTVKTSEPLRRRTDAVFEFARRAVFLLYYFKLQQLEQIFERFVIVLGAMARLLDLEMKRFFVRLHLLLHLVNGDRNAMVRSQQCRSGKYNHMNVQQRTVR